MPTLNPNRKPFPRRSFLEPILDAGLKDRLHPLERTALEPAILAIDPSDWPHTLGAIDVFLDNLGLLMGEQFKDHAEVADYFGTLAPSLANYVEAKELILPGKPWAGKYLVGKARTANAGEPRPVLRLMAEETLTSGFQFAELEPTPDEPAAGLPALDLPQLQPSRYSNVSWQRLLLPNWQPAQGDAAAWPSGGLGVPLPDGFPSAVRPIRLLSPREATPDLPLRVGIRVDDLKLYELLVRNQGTHVTCAAHAVATALNLAAHRAGKGRKLKGAFSPSWIHYASAKSSQTWSDGRTLKSSVRSIAHKLPCRESAFPYPAPGESDTWRTAARDADSRELTHQLGLPEIQSVSVSDISHIKTLLAAGWLVVVSAGFPKCWQKIDLNQYGLPKLPLEGDEYESGHAWLLVGYDHVDGNQQWKYQGRFWSLNSWGKEWPVNRIWGAGLCSLPFSYVLNCGIEAYALRFT